MSQVWTDDCFSPGRAGQTDLQSIENNFAALKSCFEGTSAPPAVKGMQWYDSSVKTTKRRDFANGAWYGMLHGDASQKMWIYRNDAMEGWTVDGTVSDKVLALKGGSTYVTGGASAGSWTLSGFSSASANHTHGVSITSGTPSTVTNYIFQPVDNSTTFDVSHTHLVSGNTGTESAGHTHTHDGTSRIAAAVGTLQYINL